MAIESSDGGIFCRLLRETEAQTAPIQWACGCAACGAAIADAQGGDVPGGYATTPTEAAYRYVTQTPAPLQDFGGNVAALMAGSKWSSVDSASAKTIVTFSFTNPATSTFAYSNGDFQATLTEFSAADKQLTREILARIEAVANVQFVEVADNSGECGVLRYGYSQQPNVLGYAGYAFFPSSSAIGGDIWIGAAQARPEWSFYRADLFLHETLHALGLKHPFDTGATLAFEQNIIPNTVMSYSTLPGGLGGYMSNYPSEPMAMDIAALQYMYGASNLNAGNNSYDLNTAQMQTGFHAIWDAGGVDTFDASRVARAVTLDLNEGGRSDIGSTVTASARLNGGTASTTYTSTITIAHGATIENAVGSAYNDVITGNGAANALWGGAGNDRLEGRVGNDVLDGGAGNDVLDGGAGMDMAVYEGSRSTYTISRAGGGFSISGGSAGTDLLTGIERLVFGDSYVALDMDGNAAIAAQIVGAVFGVNALDDAQYAGMALRLLDGGMSFADVTQLAIDTRLGGHASNTAVVDLLYTNVIGHAPTASESAPFVDLLDSGAFTQGSLGQLAACTTINQANIDLVGLASTGLEYIL